MMVLDALVVPDNSPPTPECESIPSARPILSSRHILFQLISINICVRESSQHHLHTLARTHTRVHTHTRALILLSGTPSTIQYANVN